MISPDKCRLGSGFSSPIIAEEKRLSPIGFARNASKTGANRLCWTMWRWYDSSFSTRMDLRHLNAASFRHLSPDPKRGHDFGLISCKTFDNTLDVRRNRFILLTIWGLQIVQKHLSENNRTSTAFYESTISRLRPYLWQ